MLLIGDEHVVMCHSQALFGLTLALGDLDRWDDPDKVTIVRLAQAALPIQMGRAAGMDEDLATAYGQPARVHKPTLAPREFRKALEPLSVKQR